MANRLLAAGIVVLAIAVLFLAAGAVPVRGGQQTLVFETPAFLAVVAAGTGLLLAACFLRRPLARQLAFALTHAGLVLLLLGAAIDWRREQRLEGIRLPVGMGHAIRQLRDPATVRTVALGFALEITDLTIAHYDPVYTLLRPDGLQPPNWVVAGKVDPRVPATLRRIPSGNLNVDDLKTGDKWKEELPLPDGWILRKQAEVPRGYGASVRIAAEGGERTQILAVNHPLSANGWQVLLASCGRDPIPYVELMFKRCPGRPLVFAGIWSVIAGVFLLCLVLPLIEKERHAAS